MPAEEADAERRLQAEVVKSLLTPERATTCHRVTGNILIVIAHVVKNVFLNGADFAW